MIISFIGPSGCGKGTQSKILVEKDNFVSISGGAILREEYRKNTDIGVELFNKYWKKGLWVPDDIIFKFIIKKFNDTENIISNNVQMIQKISHSNNLLYDIHKNRIYILNMISMRLAQKGILNINLDIISLNEIINIIISEFKKYKRKLNIDFNIDETIKSYILMDRILFENIINVILIFAEENHIQTVHISLTSIPDFMQIQISFDNNISTYFKENNISEIQNKISWMQLLAIYATSLGGNYNMQPNGINLNFVKSLIQ